MNAYKKKQETNKQCENIYISNGIIMDHWPSRVFHVCFINIISPQSLSILKSQINGKRSFFPIENPM